MLKTMELHVMQLSTSVSFLIHLGIASSRLRALSYAEQVVKLMDSLVMAGKATVEMNKELNTRKWEHPCCTKLLFSQICYFDTAQTSLMHGFKLLKDDGHMYNQINAPSLSGTKILNHQVTCCCFLQKCTSVRS
ncbi:hypothetical protein JHK82_037784 [Glycine max]|nr:hypothetical protein JHK82_037784 [Glycine max]